MVAHATSGLHLPATHTDALLRIHLGMDALRLGTRLRACNRTCEWGAFGDCEFAAQCAAGESKR